MRCKHGSDLVSLDGAYAHHGVINTDQSGVALPGSKRKNFRGECKKKQTVLLSAGFGDNTQERNNVINRFDIHIQVGAKRRRLQLNLYGGVLFSCRVCGHKCNNEDGNVAECQT